MVAGGLPELRRFAGMVGLASTADDYPGQVRAAMAGDGGEKRAARVALAADNSWDHRVTEISALVEAALARGQEKKGQRRR